MGPSPADQGPPIGSQPGRPGTPLPAGDLPLGGPGPSNAWPRAFSLSTIGADALSSLAVFFVAVPLCLGIAGASGAPLLAGLIAGVIGGVVTGALSGSPLAVSGPAAGLTALTLAAIGRMGSYEAFLAALVVAGGMQLVLAASRAGGVVRFVPHTVIDGMLAGIGMILILKQWPLLIGARVAYGPWLPGAALIGVITLGLLAGWGRIRPAWLARVPAQVVVVPMGIGLEALVAAIMPGWGLPPPARVDLPPLTGLGDLAGHLTWPDWRALGGVTLWWEAASLALVASIETLLCIEALDGLDPLGRRSPPDRELAAQGVGNGLSGLIGGIPITAVIIRGTVNLSAGARTKASAILHGVLIVIAMIWLWPVLNLIPMATLAAVLVYSGYHLLAPAARQLLTRQGWAPAQWPVLVTLVGVVALDLLAGLIAGIATSLLIEKVAKLRHRG